jgi:cytochrome c553
MTRFTAPMLAATLALWATSAAAQEATGEAIYDYCQSCHGKRGEGGEGGKYPRIAGLPQSYVDKQLHDFKEQRRINKPMIPIFKHHRFDDDVIATVSAYIADMGVPDLALWPNDPDPEAVAAYESRGAFTEAGARKYADGCSGCHGETAAGDPLAGVPPLVDQYPSYLRKQLADFATDTRRHRDSAACADIAPGEAEAVIDYLVELGK